MVDRRHCMYILNHFFKNNHFQDLNPLSAGEQACAPGYCFGPHVRKFTLIHYVLSGKGTFYTRGNSYIVEAGQAFLILPGEVTTYIADEQDPWHYQWITFDGDLSKDFVQLPPVFPVQEDIFRRAFIRSNNDDLSAYHFAAILFLLYDSLFSVKTNSNQHVSKVENYIQINFMHPIRVKDIATQLNLDRCYLSRLFKEKTGRSIQEHLMQVRLDEAYNYLQKGYSVSDTAAFCGYESVTNFSRMFKKFHGVSPAKIKQNKENS